MSTSGDQTPPSGGRPIENPSIAESQISNANPSWKFEFMTDVLPAIVIIITLIGIMFIFNRRTLTEMFRSN